MSFASNVFPVFFLYVIIDLGRRRFVKIKRLLYSSDSQNVVVQIDVLCI